MALSPLPNTDATYQAAAQWKDACLLGNDSILQPGLSVWTPEVLEEFRVRFVENTLEDQRTFQEKLEEQLAPGSPNLKRLAAEMMWVLYLFPNSILPATKRDQIQSIWGWSGTPLPADTPALGGLDHGIGNPGQGFNTRRWKELGFLWRAASTFKGEPVDRQIALLSSPWAFAAFLDGLEDAGVTMMRHILLHLLFPDTFENTGSIRQKKEMAEKLGQAGDEALVPEPSVSLSPAALVDLQVLRIRRRLEQSSPEGIVDFYDALTRPSWDGAYTVAEGKDPWWQMFFDSEDQADKTFDFLKEVMIACGTTDSVGKSAQRISFTYIQKQKVVSMRVNCGQVQVLWISEKGAGEGRCGIIVPVAKAEKDRIVGELKSTYAGARIGFYHVELEDLLLPESDERLLLFEAIRSVAETYKHIEKRNWEKAHRPRLLAAVFDPEKRPGLFEEGPRKGPEETTPDEPPMLRGDDYTLDHAMEDLFMEESKLLSIIALLKRKKNIILQGAPGTGKTFVARRLAYLLMGTKDANRAPITQFHQSTSYEDFIQGYRPDGNGGFELKDGIFHSFCLKALKAPDEPHVFIIDEINRGNIAKILGELMMLIEPDKRSPDFAVPLTYAKSQDETFHVPPNVYLIGTMNTADRSLSLVDYALRRRFAFIEAEPGFDSPGFRAYLGNAGAGKSLIDSIVGKMNELNTMIEDDKSNLGRGYRIGHSFFVPAPGITPDEAWLEDVLQHEIRPLLEEYWVDNEKALQKAREILR